MQVIRKWSTLFLLLTCACLACGVGTGDFANSPDRYNVVWDTPSEDHSGSMPLGNGSTGLNAWIEPSGDLVFYISRTDSWGDNGRLLKVGKVRITLDPAPSTDDFLQTLSLIDGTLKARCGETEILLWVDANHPVIHAEFTGPSQTEATASFELWRTEQVAIPNWWECSDVNLVRPSGENGTLGGNDTLMEPDNLLKNQQGQIGWYHRNIKSVGPEMHAKIQGVDGFERTDPLLHRTFGGIITAENAQQTDDTHLVSPASHTHRFDVYVHTEHPSTEAEWLGAINRIMDDVATTDIETHRKAHAAWWQAFWQRSWIHATGAESSVKKTVQDSVNTDEDAYVVSRGYALQRYINACAGRGAYPIKFNGSIFTVDGYDHDANCGPDYRRWGGGYWWQNTRLPYISMCASGDLEMTDPLYKMYCQDLFEYHKYRTKVHTGHDGIYIPECIYFWGEMFAETYGWTPIEEREDKLQENRYHKWEWVSGPEIAFMMLDRYEHTLEEGFLKSTVLPFANEILIFFDQQYNTGPDGKLVMHPSQALETWWECTNPMPEVAGLHAVIDRLLALPEDLTDPEMRAYWSEVKMKLPDLPTREVDGVTMFAPAEKFENKRNGEVPELYSVFPFRLCAFEKANVNLGLEALNHRVDRGNSGWRQDEIFMAYLGLADEARQNLVGRARTKDDGSRFPAFWGPNFDWIPDQDHGGILLKALQTMVLQTDGRKIYLLPAWPKDWNVAFKLHAPYKTVIEGRVKDGKLVEMNVTPASRRKDVIVLDSQ
jgi:alpha-L-fucosidase 2